MLKQYQYDQDKNLTGLFVQSGNAILANNRYLYDGNGNRTRKQQLGGETLYHYDPLNQLQKVQYPGYTEELFYDKAGNRTKRIAQGVEELYQYDPRNRLTAYTKNGATTLFRYDHAGNLLADDKARYSYDAFNRTTRVETFDGNIQVNRYDAESLRHEMEENGNLVKFIFNPDREAVVESDAHNLIRYIRSSELIARNTDAARTYYHYVSDEIGSVTHVVDADGIVLNRYEYDAWGNTNLCEEKVPNRFKFTGQQLDPVTQQYYLRARFYNPIIARFTQEDTYRGDGLNLYSYCANRPTYYIDPTGHWCDTKQDVFNKLAAERGLDPDNMDYDTKQRLMAEASNIVKEQKKNPYAAAQNATLALPENTTAANQPSMGAPTTQSGTGKGSINSSNRRLVNINDWNGDVNNSSVRLYGTYNELRNAGVKDAHHIIQDASVRDVAGYKKGDAPAIQADGPSTKVGSEHYNLTFDQSHATKGGTYGIEKNIGLNSIKIRLKLSKDDMVIVSDYTDSYFINNLEHLTKPDK